MSRTLSACLLAAVVGGSAAAAPAKSKSTPGKAPAKKEAAAPKEGGAARPVIRNLGAEKDLFIAPDESFSASLGPGWQVKEMEAGNVYFLVISPAGEPVEQAKKVLFAFPGELPPDAAALSDTALLTAGLQRLVQSELPFLQPKGEAKVTQFGARKGAEQTYAAEIPGENTTVTLWSGLVREQNKYLMVSSLGRGAEHEASQKVAQRMLETVKPYQAPRNPELEKALLGRWSGIRSAKTTGSTSSSVTVTYQFNPDGTFWKRLSGSYLSSGGVGTLSGASDNFTEGTYTVLGKYVVVKTKQGGELRLRIQGPLAGDGAKYNKIGGDEVVRGEL